MSWIVKGPPRYPHPWVGPRGGAPHPAHWAVGLSSKDSFEWLCNAYCLRCDDDYAFGGCYLHGPYDPDNTPLGRVLDFLVFCVLAKRKGVIPADWPWPDFLRAAVRWMPYAFEKSDAQERWGNENFFSGAMGGRSLRYTAFVVYGSGSEEQCLGQMHSRLLDQVFDFESLLEVPKGLFAEVGGFAVWSTFSTDLQVFLREKGMCGE